jgi:hypothetical protein
MNKKEFRFGNLVKYEGRIFEIDSICSEFPTLNTIEFGVGVVDWNNISPILLRDNLITKAFKEKLDECGIDYATSYRIGSDGIFIMYVSVGFVVVEVEYIHQAQNLLYAITQEELVSEEMLKNISQIS